MKEELFTYTLKKYGVSEYLDTNPIRPIKIVGEEDDIWFDISDKFGEITTNYTPWGDYTIKGLYDTEEKFVEHYGNPMTQLNFNRVIVCVTKENDKVSFKVFNYSKTRRLAGKWFKIKTNCKFITFNFKTNALYTGSLDNYHLKTKCRKRVSRILFNNDPINNMRRYLRESFNSMVNNAHEDIPTVINQIISTFVNAIPGTEKYLDMSPDMRMYKQYLDRSEIKYSNNWFELMKVYPQPKKKDLVKCEYKYIDALMKVHNLKGDKVKRVLHNVKSFLNSHNFLNACGIFGEKFILNQPDEFIQTLLESEKQMFSTNINVRLSKLEVSNFFEIYKIFHKGEIDYITINDHFRFYRLLEQMEPVKWTSRTPDEFVQEHYEWSEKYNHYTNGDFTRIYNQGFINKVNDVILTKDGPYFPEVLTTSKRYNNESLFQSNCVKTYIRRIDSLLISMRRGEGETEERASIEYRISIGLDRETLELRRHQTLGKYNKRLDESWSDALIKLDSIVWGLESDGFFDTLQIEAEFKTSKLKSNWTTIDGIDYTSLRQEDRKLKPQLCWENDLIMKINSYNYNELDF